MWWVEEWGKNRTLVTWQIISSPFRWKEGVEEKDFRSKESFWVTQSKDHLDVHTLWRPDSGITLPQVCIAWVKVIKIKLTSILIFHSLSIPCSIDWLPEWSSFWCVGWEKGLATITNMCYLNPWTPAFTDSSCFFSFVFPHRPCK